MLTSGVFWGSLLILWGVSLIVETVFHVHVPFARIAFALIVIYVGIRILTGGRWGWSRCWGGGTSDHEAIFSRGMFGGTELKDNYSVVFGEGEVDLSRSDIGKGGAKTAVRAVFGSARVLVSAKQPVRVTGSAAFGEVRVPDGTAASFGEVAWESPAVNGNVKPLEIRIEAVFGKVEVVAR